MVAIFSTTKIIVQLQHLVASLAFTMHTVCTSMHKNLYLFIYRAMVHIYVEYSEIVCTSTRLSAMRGGLIHVNQQHHS